MPVGSKLKIVPWEMGTPEVSLLAVLFGVFVGVPLLLFSPSIIASTSLIFYLFLWLIGVFGHTDDVRAESLLHVRGSDSAKAVLVGIITFVVLEMTFILNFSLLETTPSKVTPQEALWFNIAFVIVGEELVFRDTLPYYLTFVFMKGTKDELSATLLAILTSSVAFGVFHIVAYRFDYLAVAKAIIAGVILGFARAYSGLLASYIGHFMFNVINLLGLLTILAPIGT